MKVWLARRSNDCPAFYLIGDPDQPAARAQAIGLQLRLAETEPRNAMSQFESAVPVVPLHNRLAEKPGRAEMPTIAAS